jgi:polysaccharide export outer membrane protein
LTFANGPAERAGRSIQVIHAADSPVCEAPTSASEDALKTGLVSFSLISTLQGREPSNPFVQPGDIITIPEAEQAFIVGNVLRPTAIPLKEPTSISRAVAFAGGTMPDTKNDGVRIIRQLPGSATKTEIHVDLKAIEKRQAEDVLLQANDIVDVPTSGGKRFMRTLLSTIAPAAGQLPVQVIRR